MVESVKTLLCQHYATKVTDDGSEIKGVTDTDSRNWWCPSFTY